MIRRTSIVTGGVSSRQNSNYIRVTCIQPGVVKSELADTDTDAVLVEAMKSYPAIGFQRTLFGRLLGKRSSRRKEVDVEDRSALGPGMSEDHVNSVAPKDAGQAIVAVRFEYG